VPILLLIRHGVTETTGKRLTAPDLTLSERGREQAATLAERLRGLPIAAIYSSPLLRCRQTAAPLAEATGLEVRPLDQLRDTEYGEWSGRSLRQVGKTKLWQALRARPSSVRFPGGETLPEVQARTVAAMDAVVSAHPRGVVAVVSHADVIRLAVMHFVGLHVDFIERVVVGPASVSAVSVGQGVPRLLALNWGPDLQELAPPRKPQKKRAPRKVGG
jgi:probable phosphomutase (TIGR03848 family)